MQEVSIKDISLKEYSLENLPLLKTLRDEQFKHQTEICIERAALITDYLKNHGNKGDPEIVRRAKAVRFYLSNRKAVFLDNNLLAGGTTAKLMGAPLYPEFVALFIWPELETIGDRKINPHALTKEDAQKLNREIYPFWLDKTVLEVARTKAKDNVAIDLFERLIFFIAGKAGCISHTVPFYETVLRKGIKGIISEAAEKEKCLKPEGDNLQKIYFYRSVQEVLQGVVDYAKNLSTEALRQMELATELPKKEVLKTMAQVLSNVPVNPPSSFREAVNSIWLAQIAVHAENINMAISPGRLDQILYEYYENDVKDGKITIKEALELIGCLWLKLGDNVNMVPDVTEKLFGGAGTAPAVTLGGINRDGEDAVNDLTYLMLKVTEMLKIRDPNLNARYYPEVNSKEYRNRVCEVISSTKAVPAFHNDIENIKTLMNQGVSLEDARDFAVIGCVELAESGRGYQASSSIILNLVTPFLMTLYNGQIPIIGEEVLGPKTGNPEEFKDFDEFFTAYKKQLAYVISRAVELNELLGKTHQEILPTPLLSAFMEGPMEKGMDLIFGGAKYNSSGATHIGFADTVDSLCAIWDIIYYRGKYSMKEMLDALKTDFGDNYKEMQSFIKAQSPRYGTRNPKAIEISQALTAFIYDTYQGYTNYRGGKYRPAYWTMTNHSGQGQICGALPNGRNAKMSFASGITPVSGASETLTDCLYSVSSLKSENIPGNYALNLKFSAIETQEDIEKFGQFVESYFKMGGMQVQFNIMSYELLEKVKKDPSYIPQLMVRVSGYSAYFQDLNDSMQDELINRAQYDINSGNYIKNDIT